MLEQFFVAVLVFLQLVAYAVRLQVPRHTCRYLPQTKDWNMLAVVVALAGQGQTSSAYFLSPAPQGSNQNV